MGHRLCGAGALAGVLLALVLPVSAQSNEKASPVEGKSSIVASAGTSKLRAQLEANVKTEWDAFQKKDKKAYSDLLADDFAAVEDDNQGMRTKAAAAAEEAAG